MVHGQVRFLPAPRRAWFGAVALGMAWLGSAGLCEAWVLGRGNGSRAGSIPAAPRARLSAAGRGSARHGSVWHGIQVGATVFGQVRFLPPHFQTSGKPPTQKKGPTVKLFQPTGTEALWQPLYNAAAQAEYGDVLTFADIEQIVGRDIRADRYPVREAMRHLERDAHRTLTAVRGVGYRVANPAEHLTLAKQHQKRARRQTKRALAKTSSADRAGLTGDERHQLDALELNLQRQAEFLGRLSRRVERVEIEQIGAVVVSEHHENRIKALEESLSKFASTKQ